MSDGWVTEPHPVDPDIAAAVDHVEALLPERFVARIPTMEGRICRVEPVDPVTLAASIKRVNAEFRPAETRDAPTLSDNPDRVLRASELVPNTWEALVGRLSAGERRELFGVMRP
jgi:hypothetical protein